MKTQSSKLKSGKGRKGGGWGNMKTSQQGLGDMAEDKVKRRPQTHIYTQTQKATSD